MKIGAVYPQTELSGDPAALGRFGREVEAMGLDHLLIYDHVAGAAPVERDPPIWGGGPYTDAHPFHDPLVAFAYLAGVTQRIEFITGVLILPQRQTLLVARQAADVDLLSGERLSLGVGLGWSYPEYDALGQDFKTRGARMSEQIPYLRQLWSEPRVTLEGRFDRIDRMRLNPQPRRMIPIYCGGFSEPAYRRAAKLADGFIYGADVEGAIAALEFTRARLAEEGRDAAAFRPIYMVQHPGGRGTSLDETVTALAKWQEAGGTDASIVTMGMEFTTVDQHLDYLAEVQAKIAAG